MEFESNLPKDHILDSLNSSDLSSYFVSKPQGIAFFTILNLLIVILSFAGNGLVLFGSLKYRAIHLDKISVMFVESLAISDLLATILWYLPAVVNVGMQRWMFGEELCHFFGFFRYVPSIVQMFIIAFTGCYKLKRLCDPLSLPMETSSGRCVIMMIWVVSGGYVALWTMVFPRVIYAPLILMCVFSPDVEEQYFMMVGISYVLFILTTMTVIILTNLYILYIATKPGLKSQSASPKLRKPNNKNKAIITISLICWLFITSYLPYAIGVSIEITGGIIPVWFAYLQNFILSLNVFANPIVYTATNARFLVFMKKTIHLNNSLEGIVVY